MLDNFFLHCTGQLKCVLSNASHVLSQLHLAVVPNLDQSSECLLYVGSKEEKTGLQHSFSLQPLKWYNTVFVVYTL